MGALCCKQDPLDLGGEVDLSHFVLLRSVGKGAFGKVRVVQHKGTKQLFALKYINKTKCIGMRAVDNIISERRLLEKISYGLTVNMRYAFQDDENLFMVLDLMLGGDLRFHLDRLGTIPEASVQFYAAQVALSLNYLHSKRIIHRDLKPDNILLNENGHAHITDFNIAVRFQESKPLTSIAGSMAYMAPEILQKRGYFAAVDWWSLGVVCFELLFGKRPFRGKTNEALQNAIMYDPLRFPENHSISSHAIEFLKALMTRDPNSRLGYNEQGFARFKAHPWMQGMRWELLEHKQAVPPFVPDRKRANFDPTHELEEILLEENPLKVRKRSPKRSGSNINMSLKSHTSDANLPEMSPEWQRMEEKFLPFDFTKPVETLLQAEQRYRIQEQPSIRAQNEKHGSYVSSYSHQTAATNTTTTTATNTNPNNVTPYTANTANTGHNNNNNNSSNYYYNSNNNNHNNNHINHNNNPEDLSRKGNCSYRLGCSTPSYTNSARDRERDPLPPFEDPRRPPRQRRPSSGESMALSTPSRVHSDRPLMSTTASSSAMSDMRTDEWTLYDQSTTTTANTNTNTPSKIINDPFAATAPFAPSPSPPPTAAATATKKLNDYYPLVGRPPAIKYASVSRAHGPPPLPPPTGMPPPIPTEIQPIPYYSSYPHSLPPPLRHE